MFKINNWGSDTSNVKNSLGGISYFRYYNEENNDITAAGYFPDNLRLKVGDRIVCIPQDTSAADELYVVTAVHNGTPTIALATGGGGEGLPDQTGHSGEFLTTDGTNPSWAAVDALPDQTGYSGRVLGTDGSVAGWVVPERVQRDVLPQAAEEEVGNIYEYVGATDANYTNGYFYKCVSAPSSAVATSSNPGVTVSVNVSTFETQITTTGQYVFKYNAGTDAWYDSNNNPVVLADYGITKQGVSVSGDTITIDYTAAGYSWAQTNVQPTPEALPDQTGQNGKFLTTNGTSASWSDKPLVNNTNKSGSIAIGASSDTGYSNAVAVGTASYADTNGTAVGGAAMAGGSYGFAIGNSANSDSYAAAIGTYAQATANGAIAIGSGISGSAPRATAKRAIQLGSTGQSNGAVNNDANTFKVANENGNFEIMNANGNLPADRLASITGLADGNYRLRLTMASGVPTLSWVAE